VSAWSHCAGLLLALPGTLLLWRRSSGDQPAKRLCLLVFGLSLASCYAASTLYHGVRIPARRLALFDRLDRIGIFLLIAGTYTPLAWSLMRGRWRWVTLTTIWSFTAVASGLLAIGGPFPPLWTTGLYLGMGWGVVVCFTELARVVPRRALRPLVAGGLLYSVGAVLNLLRWPVLWPGHFGGHELFHLFVLGDSVAHYRLMLRVVVPFAPRPDLRPATPFGAVEPESTSWSRPYPTGTPVVSGR
jgi:hemolysin III